MAYLCKVRVDAHCCYVAKFWIFAVKLVDLFNEAVNAVLAVSSLKSSEFYAVEQELLDFNSVVLLFALVEHTLHLSLHLFVVNVKVVLAESLFYFAFCALLVVVVATARASVMMIMFHLLIVYRC